MKTKYILVGGYPHKTEDGGKAFYEELLAGKSNPKILICLFARPEESWDKAFSQDKNFFETNFSEVKIDIKLANIETFLEELRWCDTVYFRGGDIDLVEVMKKYSDWRSLLEGKTVVGSSMGAYMLSKYYYDISTNDIKEGLGLTETKVIVHFESSEYSVNWDNAYLELIQHKESLQTFRLREGEFLEYRNIKLQLDTLGHILFEAKSAYFLWKSLAYSRSINIVSETLAHKYSKIQGEYVNFFVTTERAVLSNFVISILKLFDNDFRAFSFKKVDLAKSEKFINENALVFQKLKKVRDTVFAHNDMTHNTDEVKPTLPSLLELDAFIKKLFKFYNSLTKIHLDATTIFDSSSNDLLNDIERVFKNLDIGEELRKKQVDQRWMWEEDEKQISKVFETDDRK